MVDFNGREAMWPQDKKNNHKHIRVSQQSMLLVVYKQNVTLLHQRCVVLYCRINNVSTIITRKAMTHRVIDRVTQTPFTSWGKIIGTTGSQEYIKVCGSREYMDHVTRLFLSMVFGPLNVATPSTTGCLAAQHSTAADCTSSDLSVIQTYSSASSDFNKRS